MYEETSRRFKLMHDHLSAETHQKYMAITARMFRSPSAEQRGGGRVVGRSGGGGGGGGGDSGRTTFSEELRFIKPAAGMLYSGAGTSQERAAVDIEMEARRIAAHMLKNSNIMGGWFQALGTDNQLVAAFNPDAYRREVFTKRSVFLLSEVLGLLFVTCLFVPSGGEGTYMCPGDDISGFGGVGGLIEFPTDGDVLDFLWNFVTEEVTGAIVNTFYLWPIASLLYALYTLTNNIAKTRFMHEQRLLELREPRKLLSAFDLEDGTDLCVAVNMLTAARYFIQQLSMVIQWRKKYLDWPLWVQNVIDNTCGLRIPQHHRLEEHWDEMKSFIQQIDEALDQIRDTVDRLDGKTLPETVEANEEAALDEMHRSGDGGGVALDDAEGEARRRRAGQRAARRGALVVSGHHTNNSASSSSSSARSSSNNAAEHMRIALETHRRSVRRHKRAQWWAWASGALKSVRRERQQQAARASLPHEVQLMILRREALIESFTGDKITVFRRTFQVTCILRPFVRWFKLFCFENFAGLDDPSDGTSAALTTMEKQKGRAMMLGFVYLMFVTFFIFLTAVQLHDNKTITLVLITTFVSEGTSVLMVHPIEALIVAGFLPAMAASFYFNDVAKHMAIENRKANMARRLDAHKRVVDPDGPFELSPEWARIEAADVFSGTERHGSTEASTKGASKVLSGARTRVAGVVVGGDLIKAEVTSWDLHEALQRRGVKSLRDLRNRVLVSKAVLANDLKLTNEQVDIFWQAVHKPIVDDQGAKKHTLRMMMANLFGGASKGKSTSPLGKKKPSSVFPVLPSSEEKEVEPREEETEDKVASAVMKFKQLRVRAKDGVTTKISESRTPRGVTELRSPTHQDEKVAPLGETKADDVENGTVESAEGGSHEAGLGASDGLAPEPVKEQAEHVGETNQEGAAASAPAVSTEAVEAPMTDNNASQSCEDWLDGIQNGYGALYAPLFTTRGAYTADEIHDLDDDALRDIVRELKEKNARRAIRAAVKDHLQGGHQPMEANGNAEK